MPYDRSELQTLGERFVTRFIAVTAALTLIGCAPGDVNVVRGIPASGSESVFAFTNNEGATANDLHVQYNMDVDNAYYSPFTSVASMDVNETTYKYYGADVNNGARAIVKVRSKRSGNGEMHVVRWWWTSDGRQVGTAKDGDPK